MSAFFWITGGLFLAGVGIALIALVWLVVGGWIESRREQRLIEFLSDARKKLAGDLVSLSNWFSEWPQVSSLIDLAAKSLLTHGHMEGGEIRRRWIQVLEVEAEARRAKAEAEWRSLARKARPVVQASEDTATPVDGERL